MKRLLLFACCFPLTTVFAQQSKIRGVVSIHNSATETGKRVYVMNAQIEDDFEKAQPVVSDQNGEFVLIYVGIPDNTTVSFHVKKTGLEVVNKDALPAIAGQNEWIRISMAPREKMDEYRRQIYQIGKTEA